MRTVHSSYLAGLAGLAGRGHWHGLVVSFMGMGRGHGGLKLHLRFNIPI